MKLTILIPSFNEADNIGATLKELIQTLRQVSHVSSFEILVIDDHSSDQTFQVVEQFANKNILGIRLSRRSGSHVALRAGLQHCSSESDAVLCIAADGQDDPKVIKDMIQKWMDGTHIVWALRQNRDEPLAHKLFALGFYKLLTILTHTNPANVDLSRADFYLLDRKVVSAINLCPEQNTSLFGLVAWIGFQHGSVEYLRRSRRNGHSKWNFSSRIKLASDWIIAFSGIPLRLTTYLGLGLSGLGFLYALFIIINALLGNLIQGWSSIMVGILVIGGIQLTMLGIIGEYVWRNLDESRRRPLFFIEKSSLP